MSEEDDFVAMTFDPDLKVNPHHLIRMMKGKIPIVTKDDWEDAKECCADMLEQFVAMRRARG
jgi:hypothetical protein